MSNSLLKSTIVILALLLAALALNPGADKHRQKLKEAIAERSRIAALLRLGDVAAFASTYHSLGVASYTRLNGRTVSIGAFGWVWVGDLAQ